MSPFLFHSLGAEKFHPFTLKVKRVNTRMGNHGTDPPHAWVASGENNISTEPIHKGHRYKFTQGTLVRWKAVGREP